MSRKKSIPPTEAPDPEEYGDAALNRKQVVEMIRKRESFEDADLRGAGLLGGYLRVRAPGEFRHNLRLGAEPAPCPPDPRDEVVIRALAPHLEAAGVWFAGIDVIDGCVVEVNTLNPGGIHFTATFSKRPIARSILDVMLQASASVP